MTHNANHVTDHNELRSLVLTELTRFGLGDTLGGPWNVGDPDHLGRHNAMVDALALIATTAGRTYTTPLPPHRALGEAGHIGDHDVMRAAAVEAATWPAWNSATGGTVTDVPNYNGTGQTWRVHTFTASGTFTVAMAAQPFRALVIGGGGSGGSGQNVYAHGGGGGAGGVFLSDTLTIPAGIHAVTVGNGGASVSNARGNDGGASSIGSLAIGNGGGGGGAQNVGAGKPGGNGGGGAGTAQGAGGAATQPGGFAGGSGNANYAGSGGGGASAAGSGHTENNGGKGGAGITETVTGTNRLVAGGGGGSGGAAGGTATHGGGRGQGGGNVAPGTANTGGGGGGRDTGNPSGAGGSGLVAIAYRIG